MYTAPVSVIIPCTRVELVEIALAKLQHQSYPAELIEIIVVGKGIQALAQRWSLTALEPDRSFYPGEGRNIGARHARGTYFLFLDDDCEPDFYWVEQNVLELQRPEVGAVGGQIAGKSDAFFARCVDFSSFAFCQINRRMETQICSASMGVRRAVYEELEGFNERLRTCEDIDFCYRLMKHGYKTIYQPAVKVQHNHRRNSFTVLMHYNFFFGRVSGLHVKPLHPGMTRRNRILAGMRAPAVYACMILPVALGITAIIVRTNIREYPRVLLYAPFIFLAKVAFHFGVLRWIMEGPKILEGS